jgi:hypothetical protein
MNASSWIPRSTKYTWIATLLGCLIIGDSSNKLATSGIASKKRSWIIKKAEQASKI